MRDRVARNLSHQCQCICPNSSPLRGYRILIQFSLVLLFLNLSYAASQSSFSADRHPRSATFAFILHQRPRDLPFRSSKEPKTTLLHAKINKIASSFDLNEILSNERQFATVSEDESMSTSRRRTPAKDRKRKKLKELLEKQKNEKQNTHQKLEDKEAHRVDTVDESGFERETILNSIEFEYHEVDSSEDGKRVDGLLAQLLNTDTSSNEATISRSQCGALLGSGCVFLVPQENAAELKAALDSQPMGDQNENIISYSLFQKIGMPLDKKSHQLEHSSFLIYPSRNSLQSSSVPLLSNSIPPTEIIPQKLPLDILYEDECLIVINKEAGMVVHPATGNWDGTVVNALSYYLMNESPYGAGDFFGTDGKHEESCSDAVQDGNDFLDDIEDGDLDEDDFDSNNDIDINQNDSVTNSIATLRPGIVHRLDKGTTGVLVVAKTRAALATLSEAFAQRRVKKQYLAIAIGNPGEDVRINKPIGRHPLHRQRMRVVPDPSASSQIRLTGPKSSSATSKQGRIAISHLRTLCHDGKLSIVQVQIATGRTHQIRVHLQDHGTPIYGDDVYGLSDWNRALSTRRGITRPLLHAQRLEIDHPMTGERMVFEAKVAEDMLGVMKAIAPNAEDLENILHG
ncbi:hypothetical protein HJC23_004075 [Cyclotella cryptica]|uniref:Pseudouridine synthase RsuA/RluA-like domain-containing protein n=1 Tax=Cyclotella cryptica TaxID=29204 RepID=A0ABD3PIZ3_9STRA|eukprot:CCRYP_014065-RA/>CCRYP_014065-RA protein AED:0.14 eAED:0.14 QI:0/-1/0/1/-1/1/1/0/627